MRSLLGLLALLAFPALAQVQSAGVTKMDGSGAGTGTVTSAGNGTIGSLFSASWATATTTPALSLNLAANVGLLADTVPVALSLSGQSAYPQATVNTAGANLNLAGGIGRRFYSILLNTGLATKTFTFTANGTAYTLTAVASGAGAHQFNVGSDDTAAQTLVTANNLAAAIVAETTLTGLVTPTVVAGVSPIYNVYLTKQPTLMTLTVATNAAGTVATATSGADGQATFPGGSAALPGLAVGFPGVGLWSSAATALRFSVNGATAVVLTASQLSLSSATGIFSVNGDAFLARRAAANWSLGDADAAAPVAQTLSFQGARAAQDTDTAAVAATVKGSLGTGTGASGDLVFQVGTKQTTGTTAHVAATALTLHNAGTAGVAAPQAMFADGTAVAPGIGFATAPTSGLYRRSDADISLLKAGTSIFTTAGDLVNANLGFGIAGDTKLLRAYVGTFATSVGTGTAVANIGGTYAKFVSGTGVGNGADTTDDALWTLTPIPANTFTANGDALILTMSFFTGANANDKAFGLTVGGTQYTGSTTVVSNTPAIQTAMITRVDSTHINVSWAATIGGAASVTRGNVNVAVSDLTTNTLAVVVTGASSITGAANDIKLYSGIAEFKK